MKKTEHCKKYNNDCLNCPYSQIVDANKFEHYIMCDFDLKTIRDNLNHIINERKKANEYNT